MDVKLFQTCRPTSSPYLPTPQLEMEEGCEAASNVSPDIQPLSPNPHPRLLSYLRHQRRGRLRFRCGTLRQRLDHGRHIVAEEIDLLGHCRARREHRGEFFAVEAEKRRAT